MVNLKKVVSINCIFFFFFQIIEYVFRLTFTFRLMLRIQIFKKMEGLRLKRVALPGAFCCQEDGRFASWQYWNEFCFWELYKGLLWGHLILCMKKLEIYWWEHIKADREPYIDQRQRTKGLLQKLRIFWERALENLRRNSKRCEPIYRCCMGCTFMNLDRI